MELGDYTIYHKTFHQNQLIQYGHTKDAHPENSFWHHLKSPHVIGIKVIAADQQEAKTKARQEFEAFEYLVPFLLSSDARKYQIHIGPDQPDDANVQLIFFEDRVSSSFIADFGRTPYAIENLKTQCEDFWNMTTKNNKSDMEKRIFNAAIWIGKAIKDVDRKRSFFQLVLALENLFQLDPKEHVRAGITQQLSEYIGFILGNNTDHRREKYQQVKKLYRLRSDIVHGRVAKVDLVTRQETEDIARACADWCFQNRDRFSKIEHVHDAIEEMKFSTSE